MFLNLDGSFLPRNSQKLRNYHPLEELYMKPLHEHITSRLECGIRMINLTHRYHQQQSVGGRKREID